MNVALETLRTFYQLILLKMGFIIFIKKIVGYKMAAD